MIKFIQMLQNPDANNTNFIRPKCPFHWAKNRTVDCGHLPTCLMESWLCFKHFKVETHFRFCIMFFCWNFAPIATSKVQFLWHALGDVVNRVRAPSCSSDFRVRNRPEWSFLDVDLWESLRILHPPEIWNRGTWKTWFPKRTFLFQGLIFRFHVKVRRCTPLSKLSWQIKHHHFQ